MRTTARKRIPNVTIECPRADMKRRTEDSKPRGEDCGRKMVPKGEGGRVTSFIRYWGKGKGSHPLSITKDPSSTHIAEECAERTSSPLQKKKGVNGQQRGGARRVSRFFFGCPDGVWPLLLLQNSE